MNWKRVLVAIVALGGLLPATVRSVSEGGPTKQLEMTVHSGEYQIIPENTGQRVVMAGFGSRSKPGAPMLPEKEFLIALPPGARVRRVETRGVGGTVVPQVRRIEPAPPIVPLAESARFRELADEMRRDWQENYQSVYTSDDAYPTKIGRITSSGSLRKYAYVGVTVCPFRYYPLSGKLTHYDAVRITVHYSIPSHGTERAMEVERLMHDQLADAKASELFVNFDRIKELYQTTQSPAETAALTHDYVIVTTGGLADAVSASNFVAWKTSLGYSVWTILTTDPEITSQPGVDLAEQIRNFLRSYYGTWGIQYVLFVGDYATVPMRYCFPNPDDHTHNPSDYGNPGGSVPTDFYFADLSLPDTQSWDSDGDGFHGEYLDDNPDFLAEVYVGRIPTNDLSRITYTLDKLVSFEADDGSWKDHALQPGSILFYENQDFRGYPKIDGSTLLNQIEIDLMGGWTVSHYTEQNGLDPSDFPWPAVSLAAFIDDWRTGQYGVVNWSGHGAPFGVARTVWEWDDGDGVPETDGSDVMSYPSMIDLWCTLDDDYPSIVFAVSCNVGYPEPNGVGNLGIDLLTKPVFGASAGIVSSTRPAWISADVINNPGGAESICYEFNRHGIGLDKKLGEALYDAKHYCYQNYAWDHYAEHINQCNFNLYGDPAMQRRSVATAVKEGDPAGKPGVAYLQQNYPNPFNPTTTITYSIKDRANVSLKIYNVSGQLVRTLVDDVKTPGVQHKATWDGRNNSGKQVASGVYFYRLVTNQFTQTKKMAILK